MRDIVERYAMRAIMLTPEREILLMRIHPPDDRISFWITPGGGLLPGEDPEEGLRRELREELGLDAFDLGPLVWRRQHTFNWGARRICQREAYHVVRVPRFEPRMSDAVEAQFLERFRWWQMGELSRSDEIVVPLSLTDIVGRYLKEGGPESVPPTEILVD